MQDKDFQANNDIKFKSFINLLAYVMFLNNKNKSRISNEQSLQRLIIFAKRFITAKSSRHTNSILQSSFATKNSPNAFMNLFNVLLQVIADLGLVFASKGLAV